MTPNSVGDEVKVIGRVGQVDRIGSSKERPKGSHEDSRDAIASRCGKPMITG
jgi:hypothetical protein